MPAPFRLGLAAAALAALLTLGGCVPVPPSPPQPGLEFFTAIDEVRLYAARSFRESYEIEARRPFLQPDKPPQLVVTRYPPGWRADQDQPPYPVSTRHPISEAVFDELRAYITRQDLIADSALRPKAGVATDDSAWFLSGRKGDFTLRHERHNPDPHADAAYIAICLRILTLAGISLPPDEFH